MVESCDANGMATLSLRNKFRAGDTVEVVIYRSGKQYRVSLTVTEDKG